MFEQQKNLKAYLNNIPYDQKDTVLEHIMRLMKANETIPCVRTGVARNNDDSYYCYIEAAGFVTIGKELHEIRILFPHNYPVALPQFHVAYKADDYKIENEAVHLANKVISFEKTPANQVYLNIQCPSLKVYWRSEKRNVADAYAQVEKWLNNPPLLTEKGRQRNQKDIQDLRGTITRSHADKFLLDIQLQAFELQESVEKCEKGQREIDYSLSRVQFFKKNLPRLAKSMKNFEQQIINKANELQEISAPLTFERNCDPLLNMSEEDRKKMKIIATRDGLKQGERNLCKLIESELRSNSSKFAEYKNTIRILSQKMFEAQLNYLKLSD